MSELPLLERCLSTKVSDLRRFARAVGLDVSGLVPQALLERVLQELSSLDGVERALKACTKPAQALLFDVVWHGSGMLPGRTIDGPGGQRPAAAAMRGLCEELEVKGLVHPLGYRDYWASAPGYFMAGETAAWAAAILAMWDAKEKDTPFYLRLASPPTDAQSLGVEWLADLVRVVGELSRKPAGITQAGSIYRRDGERLRRLLTPQRLEQISSAWSQLLALLPNPSGFGPWAGEAQPDIGLLLWLALGLGLLDVQDGEIKAVRDWRRRLAKRSVGEIQRRAVLGVWDLHRRAHLAEYWQRFVSPEDWFLPRRLLELTRVGQGSLYEAREPYEAVSLLRCLVQLGVLEAGTWEGEPAVHLLPAGQVVYGKEPLEPVLEGRFSILPQGDILVPPDLGPARLGWLETVAKPTKVDVVCTYQISQETLHHAVEMGVKPDEILKELEAGSRTGLPQAVRFRIEEWLGRVGRYRFVEAALLVCRSPQDAEAALAVKTVRQEVIEVLGETCLVIPAMHEERVRAALERGGLTALQGVFSPSGLYREDALKEQRKSRRELRALDWGAGTVIEAL